MSDYFFEMQLLKSIEKARKNAEFKLKYSTMHPEIVLKNTLNEEFHTLNFFNERRLINPTHTYINEIKLVKVVDTVDKHNYSTSIYGTSMVALGLPIIKKRFVTPGASRATSIASKYLSKLFPQTLGKGVRILGTNVLGRALGRAVPYVGWGLVAIDAVELIIEINESKHHDKFGGGSFGGGGYSSKW
ncbi:hypothetical protein [Pedobacter cryoconitis]|uniref:Uncharacterized protein n=1 Tax=Pedobacter cryoconitis TaxID=188932 RepID=A0A327S8A0_9SPHI|nr:hypothetical protein [Pedobacter cryoconitis]RAJ24998.1 hypothetical protein LY11_04185 [Pedobacter cryoconitis]